MLTSNYENLISNTFNEFRQPNSPLTILILKPQPIQPSPIFHHETLHNTKISFTSNKHDEITFR